jgi:single-strand selective monofunctional uracil DNA glycosylase
MPQADILIDAMRQLARDVRPLRFAAPVTHVYNPLEYAAAMHEAYLRRFARTRKKALFLGMNPGPFGMAQTGIPFGEITAVRDWLKLDGHVGKPEREHPRRLVHGLSCERSEVSGRRLWGLFAQRFSDAKAFFADHFVANYCPLAFMEASGRNLTPDKLDRSERDAVYAVCDQHLRRLVETLRPQWLIGIGAFAAKRAEEALADVIAGKKLRLGRIDHPSPANPNANRNWSGRVTRTLVELGVW